MFLDEVTLSVIGGTGGHGCVSWRREKYVPKGGPDGGDGGDGGSVYIQADANTDTLSFYRSSKVFRAQNGHPGSGQRMHGRNGDDLLLICPPGTIVREGDFLLADLKEHGDEVQIVRGGRGGFGNAHFKSSTRQRPDFAETGEPGEEKEITLELKLVADVGILGYPSVGKSTLISVISSAKPKIADYPFTTLVPNLGVVHVADRSIVVCDVPGLIEDASEGKGLGHQFLRHIERCAVLLHVLDLSRALSSDGIDPDILMHDYRTIRAELTKFSAALGEKPEIIVINKADLTPDDLAPVVQALARKKIPVAEVISAASRKGIDPLLKRLLPIVLAERAKPRTEEEEQVILSPQATTTEMGAYKITKESDGSLRITGRRLEQFTKMTNFNAEGGLLRFLDVVDKIGLRRAVARERESAASPVFIGDISVDAYL